MEKLINGKSVSVQGRARREKTWTLKPTINYEGESFGEGGRSTLFENREERDVEKWREREREEIPQEKRNKSGKLVFLFADLFDLQWDTSLKSNCEKFDLIMRRYYIY